MVRWPERTYTTSQVARFCRVKHKTVLNWIREGILEAEKTSNGQPRIRHRALLDFMYRHGMYVPPVLRLCSPKRVLIVNRDPEVVHRLTANVDPKDINCLLATACDETEANLQLTTFSPDVIVVDLTLPNAEGLRFAQHVKTNQTTRHIKVLAVVPNPPNGQADAARRAGADHIILAPLTWHTLSSLL